MKRFLPIFAAATMLTSAPAFAADEAVAGDEAPSLESTIVAQVPATAAAVETGERAKFNLTDSQIEQLRALKDKYFADNTMKKAQLSILKHQLRAELTKENVDRTAVLSIQSKINAAQADLNNARIAQVLDAQSVFTPEQRKMMHSRMLRGGFRHHGGRHGGCGKHGGFGKHGFRGHGGPGGPGPGARAEGEAEEGPDQAA